MSKSIQFKNADKIFKHKYFKLRGHDIIRFADEYKSKITLDEWMRLSKHFHNLRERWGDFEVYIKVYPSKIEIIDFLEDENSLGGVF